MNADILARNFIEVELADNKTYKMSKLNLGIIADLENWCKQKRKAETLSLVKEVYGDNPPADVFEKLLKPVKEDELDDALDTMEGIAQLLYYALLEYNPNMSLDEVNKLITVDSAREIAGKITASIEVEKKTKRKRKR